MSHDVSSTGLEGVVAAETRLSDVDGERGRLVIAGADVERLAGHQRHEAVLARLWQAARLPAPEAADLPAALGAARVAAAARLDATGDALDAADAMDALRAALAHERPGPDDAVALVAATAVHAAAWARRRAGLPALAPDPDAGHAADFLRLVRGRAPSVAEAAALDAYLVTVIDHGMNASTFAARVVASTGSDDVSAVVAAVGALKGPLHGGAPGPVLDMLDAVGEAARAPAWIAAELAAGRRIMGMGHRVYRVRDPRAAVLEAAARRLGAEATGAVAERLALARAVEEAAAAALATRHPGRRLCANVEFYTAVLLEALGLPRALFSATFAASRVGGWLAHAAEQRRTGRLIRPASRYVGAWPDGADAPAAGEA